MKSKISDNKCHNIDTNNQNDKIPESAPSELRHPQPIKTTTKISAKIKMTKTLITVWQTTSILIVGAKTTTKITVIRTRETVSIVMRATATATTITIAAAKKTI